MAKQLSTDPRKRELRNVARNKRRDDIADPHRMFWADIEEAARRVNSRQANDVRVIHIHGKASAVISRGINPFEIIIILNSIR